MLKLFKKGSKKSWPSKAYLGQIISICLQKLINSINFRVDWVSVQGKTVVYVVNSHVPRNTAKTKGGEALVRVIRLNHLSNLSNSVFVLISRSQIVERARGGWVSIWAGKVNGSDKRNLPAWAQVVHKSWFLDQLKAYENKACPVLPHVEVLFEHLVNCGHNRIYLSFSGDCRDLDFRIFVWIAEHLQRHLLLWILRRVGASVILTLINYAELVVTLSCTSNFKFDWQSLLTKAETACFCVIQIFPAKLEYAGERWLLHSFSPNYNVSSSCFAFVSECSLDLLLFCTHYLTQINFYFSDCVEVAAIIPVNHLKLKFLGAFEKVTDLKASFEVWIQIVLNLFGLPKFDPLLCLVIPFV